MLDFYLLKKTLMGNFHFSQDKITLSLKAKFKILRNNSFKTLDMRQ